MTDPLTRDAIRTQPQPKCILCGNPGDRLYQDLTDRLFSAQGAWSFKRCPDRSCGLIWLDPMPVADDLSKAYAQYYTHADSPASSGGSALRQYCRHAQSLFVQIKFGYLGGRRRGFGYFLGGLLHFYRSEASTAFLEAVPGGKLLDVGCGSGAYLASMRALGWQVQGVESDPKAVSAARHLGLNVHCTTVEAQAFPAGSFDAVMLSHVVEHLPDPLGTIAECARILKPGGKLVLFTPNTASLSHRLFKHHWRGLEPSRHLFLFSDAAVRQLLTRSGLPEVTVRPQVGSSVVYESWLLSRGGRGPFNGPRQAFARLFARIFALSEMGLQRFRPQLTDCLAAIATKR